MQTPDTCRLLHHYSISRKDNCFNLIMSSDEELKLFCWILNMSEESFSVNIGKNKTVDNLKEAMKKKKKPEFYGIDYDIPKLWKLSSPVPSSELNEKLRYAQTLQDIEGGVVELNPLIDLSEYFSLPPPRGHVHIIVQLPPNYTSFTEDIEVRQLRLLCEKYWNKGEEGRAEIYKNWTVQVPFMARPATSDQMVTDAEHLATGAQEAIPVASKTTSAPSGDTSKRSNEGLDKQLDPDFNCTVSYESLSLGHHFPDFFCNDYSSILVRKEYRDMLQHISNLHKKRKRGVVVTGMPGIGKSFFLYFVLVERILNGQRTAYQCDPTRVILMLGHRDVRIFPANVHLDPRGFPGTWALVDSNAELVRPRSEFIDTRSKFYVVQAASPEPARWTSWKKQLSADMAVMKPWSWEELYIGGTKFISPPLETLTLHNICVKYGGSARHCYTLAQNSDEVTEWERQIPNLLTEMPDIAIFEGYIAGNTIHHRVESIIKASSELITIIPNATRQPCVTLVSRHIAEHFFRAVFVKYHERFWNYFNRLSSKSESRTPARWLWELYAMRVVQTTPIGLCRLSPIESSQPLTKKIRPNPIELPFSHVIVHGDQKALGEELSRTIPSLAPTKSILFIPGVWDQVTFNVFSISGDKQVTLYQATIHESHSINANGLDFVWDALKLAEGQGMSDAKNLLPLPTRKWRIVFLIPEEAEKHWKTAQDIDFGGIEPKRQWGQYIEQFVGVLQKRTIGSLEFTVTTSQVAFASY